MFRFPWTLLHNLFSGLHPPPFPWWYTQTTVGSLDIPPSQSSPIHVLSSHIYVQDSQISTSIPYINPKLQTHIPQPAGYWYMEVPPVPPGVSRSVVSGSLWPCGLQPARLLCPWGSQGKNTGVSCQSLLQGIFLTQGLNS